MGIRVARGKEGCLQCFIPRQRLRVGKDVRNGCKSVPVGAVVPFASGCVNCSSFPTKAPAGFEASQEESKVFVGGAS